MNVRSEKAFTLLELIIAMSLSVFVYIGIITVATSMVRYQLDAGMKGSAAGGTIIALARMQKEVEDSTYIMAGAPSVGGGNALRGCNNWSAMGNAAINPAAAAVAPCTGLNNVTAFAYCVDASNILWRHYWCATTCPVGAPPAYTCGTAGGTWETIVGAKPGVFRSTGYANYFYRTGDNTGVDMHFIVGVGTATTAGTPGQQNLNPTAYYRVDTRVIANKSYSDSSD
jgi:type II secretory pathway pseudopilin PulG